MKAGRWVITSSVAMLLAACGPAAPDQRFVDQASSSLEEMEGSSVGSSNRWVTHPALDSAELDACYAPTPAGLRLLLWSRLRPTALHEPASAELRALWVKDSGLPADSSLTKWRGQPRLAFQVPAGMTPDAERAFLAKVFRECAGIEAEARDFRFQQD